jgi:ribosome-associated translation inhibitor RaiA
MKVHVHTDRNLVIDAELEARIASNAAAALANVGARVIRVDLHLTDQSAGRKAGAHVRCRAEAHASGVAPVTVTHDAPDARAALDGAVASLASTLAHTFERLAGRGRNRTIRHP